MSTFIYPQIDISDQVLADIEQNTADIVQNTADIELDVADIKQNTADIVQNTADIETDLADVKQNTADTVTELQAISTALSDDSQTTQIVNSSGTAVSLTGTYLDVNLASGSVTATNSANGATGSAVPSDATLVGGTDSGTLRAIKVSSTGVVSVDGSASTQPISATSLPLPTGAATESTLGDIKTAVELLDNAVSGNELQVDIKSLEGLHVTSNSSSTPLGSNAVFTGSWVELTNWNGISVGVYADQASATDGLAIEFSDDGINVRHSHTFSIAAGGNGYGYNLTSEFKYFRVKYTNGTVAQSVFALTTMLKPTALFPSSYKITHALNSESQALLTRSVITGETTAGGGGFVNVKVNPSGALVAEVDVASSALPTGAATEATLADIKTSVQLLDNAVSGNELQVDVVSSALPAGAATETTLDAIKTAVELLDNTVSGSELQVDIVSSALPSGAATSAAQTDGSQKSQIVNSTGTAVTVTGTALDVNLASGSVTATNSANGATGSAVPTDATMVGGSDSGTLRAIKVSSTGVVSVDASGSTQPVAQAGRIRANAPVFNNYSSSNVTTSAYVQLVASTAGACTAVEVYNQSASSLYFATGAAASEVDQFIIPPGGNGLVPVSIASSTRISVKAVDVSATTGSLIINFWT